MQESQETGAEWESSAIAVERAIADGNATPMQASAGEAGVQKTAMRKLGRGIAIVATIGLVAEMFVCGLNCLMFHAMSFPNGGEYVLASSYGLLSGYATAATVVCLLFRSWVVSFSLTICIGIVSRLVWKVTWHVVQSCIESLRGYANLGASMYFEETGSMELSVFCGIPPVLFVACLPLMLARAVCSWRLGTTTNVVKHRSIRMEDIFLSTAIVASMLVFLRVPSQLFDTDFMTTLAASLFASLWFGVLGLTAMVVTPVAFTLRKKDEMAVAISILLSVIAIAFTIGLLMLVIAGGNVPESVVGMLLLVAISLAVGATACLMGLRLSGLRLLAARNMRAPAAAVCVDNAVENTIDVLADDLPEDGPQLARADGSDQEVSNRPNRLAAVGILAASCIVGTVASNVESVRDRELQVWNDLSARTKAAGGAVRIRNDKLTGLNAGRSTPPAEIRTQLVPELETLSLRETEIDDAFLIDVAGLHNVACLDLYGTKVSGKGLEHLLDAGHNNFRYLGIGKTRVTPEELKGFLSRCTVQILDLTDMGYSGEDIEGFARSRVFGLVLSGNDITEQWLGEYLSDAQLHARLTHLDVTGLPLTGKFLDALAGSSVRCLVLDSTDVADKSIQVLSQAAALKTLSIRDTQIGVSGLPLLSSLEKLILGPGPIKENQIGIIAPQAKSLVIDQPNFTGEDLDLSKASVVHLDLSGTSLTDDGMKQIAITCNRTISTLSIADTSVTDVGLAQLSMLSILDLDVSNTQVSVSGILALPQFYGTLCVAPGQFTDTELARLRTQYFEVQIGPGILIPRVLPGDIEAGY